MSTWIVRGALATALALGACAREPARSAPTRTAPSAPEAELRAAEHALAAYLDASRDGSPTAAARDSLLGCDARGTFVLPIAMLGGFRVLPASGTGDTLLGRAVVVTVAEQRADRRQRDHYLARLRLETDTLEWDLVRRDDGWVVCNGVQFGFHEPEEATTWAPLGASRLGARRLADSIHRAWTSGADSVRD